MLDKIVRTAAIELRTTNDVVKVAGVVRRLQNAFKQLTNQEYSDAVDKLRNDSSMVQAISHEVNLRIKDLMSAIKDGDVSSYDVALEDLRNLSAELAIELRKMNSDAIASNPSSVRKYDINQWKEPGFEDKINNYSAEKVKQWHPEHDVPIGKDIMQPLNSFKWFHDKIVHITDGAKRSLMDQISKLLVRSHVTDYDTAISTLSENGVWEEFTRRFTDAIYSGILQKYKSAKPQEEPKDKNKKWIKERQVGEILLTVKTNNFNIPKFEIPVSMTVELIDMSATINGGKHLVLKNAKYPQQVFSKIPFNPLAQVQSSLEKLTKIAEAKELPYQVTSLDDVAFAKALAEGYRKVYGSDPTLEVLGGGWAQGILESGRPVKLPNNNIGNIKATKDWISQGNSYFVKDTGEYDKNHKYYTEHGTKWRAYPTPADGAAGYWKLLGGHFKDAVSWMAAGDPVSAAVSLGEKGYYTANIKKYSSAVGKLYQDFMTKIAPQFSNLKSAPASAPGNKPEVKDWKSPSNNEEGLIKALFSGGPVDRMVKNAIIREKLPTSKIIISISKSNQIFTKVASNVLKEIIDADVIVNESSIQCSVPGSLYAVTSAANALCGCINKALELKNMEEAEFTISSMETE